MYAMYYKISRVRTCILNGRSFRYNGQKKINKVSNAWKKLEYDVKNLAFYVGNFSFGRLRAKTRAKNACFARFLWKCLKCPETCAKKFGTNLSILKFWCARTCASRCARKICWHFSLTFDLKLMYTKYGWFLMTRYRDMIMTWFLQNGAWMTSRWPNDLEKVN